MDYIDFEAPCGHKVRVSEPHTRNFKFLACAGCKKTIDRRRHVEKLAQIFLTAEDRELLKKMLIGV